eukprot:TRINITY_DN8953_c1_g1_i2.p1 TRINITY_DN8953_c1_g1~~TRINITY_DN8953_c1_g1_i2.p1  ORF type:complete len:876 (-),score=253.81 TRINITY_DN8953_c1_g1_i2:67-2694(-)
MDALRSAPQQDERSELESDDDLPPLADSDSDDALPALCSSDDDALPALCSSDDDDHVERTHEAFCGTRRRPAAPAAVDRQPAPSAHEQRSAPPPTKKLAAHLEQLLDEELINLRIVSSSAPSVSADCGPSQSPSHHSAPSTASAASQPCTPPPLDTVIARADALKRVANELLQKEDYLQATTFYTKAIECFPADSADKLLSICYGNRSLANLKCKNFGIALLDACRAIDIDPDYFKGYYRRGCVYLATERYREAVCDFEAVLRESPHDRAARTQLAAAERELKRVSFKQAISSAALPAPDGAPRRAAASAGEAEAAADSGLGLGLELGWLAQRVPPLQQLAAAVVAREVNANAELYAPLLQELPQEYLKHVVAHMSWPAFQFFRQHPAFRQQSADGSSSGPRRLSALSALSASDKFELLRRQENHYRTLFAADRDNRLLADPYLTLIDVHRWHSLMAYERDDVFDRIPKLFGSAHHSPTQLDNDSGSVSIVPAVQFMQQFNVFTEGQLLELNWNNVFAAGGSVLASLMPAPATDLSTYFHLMAYRSSDIDLFIYGLTPQEAADKIREIYHAVQRTQKGKLLAVRTSHALSIVSEFPRRHIQIVLRLYKSPAEILMGFDVDSCSVGFDGVKVWATARAVRSLKYQFNLVDLSRRSLSYEQRLYKYSRRGFAVALPGFDRSRINPKLLSQSWRSKPSPDSKGLVRLIELELIANRWKTGLQGDYYYAQRPELSPHHRFDVEAADADEVEARNSRSDYSSIRIPYGPKWSIGAVSRHLQTVSARCNDWFYRLHVRNPPREHVHICRFGTIEEVLTLGVNSGIPLGQPQWDVHESVFVQRYKHVTQEEMWITENPGSQLTGSFNPIWSSREDWEKGAYV